LQDTDEVYDDAMEGRISRRVHEELKSKGARAVQLQRNQTSLAAPRPEAKALAAYTNMADVKKNFAPVGGRRGGGDECVRRSKRSMAAAPMMSRSAAPEAAMMSMSLGARGTGDLYCEADGGGGDDDGATMGDVYECAEVEMTYEQASRMVQKSVGRNRSLLKK
jgi:hypothetical protein